MAMRDDRDSPSPVFGRYPDGGESPSAPHQTGIGAALAARRSGAPVSLDAGWFRTMATQRTVGSDFLHAFLKRNTLLGGLPDKALDGLIRKGHLRKYAKGAIIYRRGEPGDS